METIVQNATESIFLTKYPDHKLIMVAARPPYVGVDGRKMPGTPGRYIQFKGNEYRTAKPDELDFLRNHELFNTDIWEFGRAPGEAQPTVEAQLSNITRASVERDVPALQALISEEESTHNRALILSQARTALASIAGGADSE